jgi:hypothetical protein
VILVEMIKVYVCRRENAPIKPVTFTIHNAKKIRKLKMKELTFFFMMVKEKLKQRK